jgi:hypothetical protein
MILTRYIYDKDNLQYSILLALLNKDREQVKFWVYELYYSGFKMEAFCLLWELYYKLYYISYPNMERFMRKQTLLWVSNRLDDCIIGTIAESLAIREPCIDSYFAIENKKQISNIPDTIVQEIVKIKSCTSKKDCFVNLENLGISCKKNVKINKKIDFTKNVFLELEMLDIEILKTASISIILDTCVKKPVINKMRKNIYIIQQLHDIKQYKTKPAIKHRGYKIPPRECKYQLQIKPEDRIFDYPDYYNWMYYASFSPLWKTRIERHNGIIVEEQKIHFENEDDEEAFYNYFNLEPDEQCLEIEERWFGYKPFDSWNELYNRYLV